MNILTLIKRVPDTEQDDLRIIGDGTEVDLSDLPFKLNDWDNYVVEEAARIVEKSGGTMTAISIGDAESDEVLRRAIALGAKEGILIEEDMIIHDPTARARIISNFIKQEGIAFDAIFTGLQAEDDQFAAFGGILAGQLGLPFASQVIGIDKFENGQATVRKELEGGLQERISFTLPGVLSIQSGINEPRYVSVMNIRKASKVERKVFKRTDYLDDMAPAIDLVRFVYPEKQGGAKMLTGDLEGQCRELLNILEEKGVSQ